MIVSGDILALLEKDRIRNINLINFIRDYPILDAAVAGDSVLVRGRSDRDWVYVSSADAHEFERLAAGLAADDRNFAVVEDWMLPALTAGRKINWRLSCLKLYLPDGRAVPHPSREVEELAPEDAAYIYEHYEYAGYASPEYIAARIAMGPGVCIRARGKPAAWIMTQDDGAMGFLTVLPEYRRRGYATDLSLALIGRLRSLGRMPFVQIEEDNVKSMNLARKLGFVPDRRVTWVGME